MEGNINPKIVGSAIIGFALVAGSYVLSNFNAPKISHQAAVLAAKPSPRVAIEVSDDDGNGIEDWRDEFITTKPVILEKQDSTYVPPETLTGQLGINFMEDIIRAKGYGPFGRSQEQVISDTVDILSKETAHDLYDTPDIIVLKEWNDQDIVNYANTMAGTLLRNNVPDVKNELAILDELLKSDDSNGLTGLKSLTEGYRRNRDDFLNTPVPAFLVKEHLDIINTFHAVHMDIEAMTKVLDDPAFTLLRLKRYQDDAEGLGYALQNLYLALEPKSSLFTTDDPAVLFIMFSPNYQN
ncbi:hypothetical protein H6784_03860 [Candidatus Nomurabacteria bacterium]|nr:hypothetical protein [Candidatus Kaiserbacteria bacterium]MCB9814525.1 hypothetical protein [Candidatus Nomurabacteria bacterium]